MREISAVQARDKLVVLLEAFDARPGRDLRCRVLDLVPIVDYVGELGKVLLPAELGRAGKKRLLYYFQQYPRMILDRKELRIVAGIDDWARRVRELRKEEGWHVASGEAIKEMLSDAEFEAGDDLPTIAELQAMNRDSYILLSEEQDRDAAHRWHLANSIRKERGGAKSKILRFLQENLGTPVSTEELRYVAGGKSEWGRRTRELRTEDGWQVATKANGRPDLQIGLYVLQSLQQLPVHDRKIQESVRREAMMRDQHTCQECGWNHRLQNPSDTRHLELHHEEHHVDGGENVLENLTTLCNICHDVCHSRKGK